MVKRNILVTGSARGLGAAMADGLEAAGHHVVRTDRTTVDGAKDGSVLLADIADTHARQEMTEKAVGLYGPIDVLINCAGLSSGGVRKDFIENLVRTWEIDEAKMRAFLEVNTLAPHLLAIELLPSMIERGFGRIINITTSLSNMLRPGMTGYGGSKAALEANTAILAGDLAGTGVTANILVPGGMADTDMIPAAAIPDRSTLVPATAMAAPAVWLASDESGGFTGQRIVASKWRTDVSPEEAILTASWPAGWPETAV
jgi:NAD(P)-dependent dehydrogenase (short-subunit alcohol dehydrogenase family)